MCGDCDGWTEQKSLSFFLLLPSCSACIMSGVKLTGRIGTALATIPLLHKRRQCSLARSLDGRPLGAAVAMHDAHDLVRFRIMHR